VQAHLAGELGVNVVGDSQPEEDRPEQCRSAPVLMQNSSKTGLHPQRALSDTSFGGGESMAGTRHRLVSPRKAGGFR